MMRLSLICIMMEELVNKKYCGKTASYNCSKNPTFFNMIRWLAGTNDSLTKHLMFQALFFFIISYWLRALKSLYFYFCKIIEKKKMNWNNFCKEFCKKLWKNNTWNIKRLVDESFVQSNQRITYIEDCRICIPNISYYINANFLLWQYK